MKTTKKLLLGLFTILCLCGKAVYTASFLVCNHGKAAIITAVMHDNGSVYYIESFAWAGGCPNDERWVVQLLTVPNTGSPAYPELNGGGYTSLNSIVSLTSPEQEITEVLEDQLANYPLEIRWVNPGKIGAIAYDLIYGTTPYSDIFYISAANNSGTYHLNLYSDEARTLSVDYSDINGVLVDSEEVDVDADYNSKPLNSPLLLPNGVYFLKVSSENSNHNVSLIVSN